MIKTQTYRRPERRDRQALKIEELPDNVIEAIARAKPPAAARRYDREVRSVFAATARARKLKTRRRAE